MAGFYNEYGFYVSNFVENKNFEIIKKISENHGWLWFNSIEEARIELRFK